MSDEIKVGDKVRFLVEHDSALEPSTHEGTVFQVEPGFDWIEIRTFVEGRGWRVYNVKKQNIERLVKEK